MSYANYCISAATFFAFLSYAFMTDKNGNGRTADTPLAMPGAAWWAILKRTYAQAKDDNVSLIAAGVAFYGFLAMVPLLGVLVLTYGLVFDPADISRQLSEVAPMMPSQVVELLREQLNSLIETSSGKKGLGLFASLGLALYGAMKGAGAVVMALNIAYEETEKRGFIRSTLTNAYITLGAVVLALILMSAALVGHAIETVVALSNAGAIIVKLGGWAVAAAMSVGALAALYRYGPSRANARWRWLTPGSLFATLGLLAASSMFGWYVSNLGNYNATYGSLGGVVVLLLWLYLTTYILLLGAELNSEIEHQTAVDTTTGPELPLGRREAVMADQVAG